MSAIRVKVQHLRLISTATRAKKVVLDCWRAQVWMTCNFPGAVAINSQNVPASLYDAFSPALPVFMEFGGMMDANGHPVNINTELDFFMTTIRATQVIIVMEYFDPALTDPMTP